MRCIASVLLAATVFCGCASGPGWKQQTFAFSVPADPPSTHSDTNVIALGRVTVSPLFQSRWFTYRIAEDRYEQDPYAGFLVSPERAIAEPIRAWMRKSGAFGTVLESGSMETPTLVAEATVDELYGDFRNLPQPTGKIAVHFVVYRMEEGAPGHIVLDKICTRTNTMTQKTPAALMAAWDTDLRQIMEEMDSDYAKANSNDGGR